MIEIAANSNIFGLSEQHYGKIKRVGMLNNEPILYGDPNLLKNNDLYYIIGAKQVYRYIKCEVRHTGGASSPGILNPTPGPVGGNVFNPNATTKEYYFETFNGLDSEVLSVTEDERGKIRNAGYLFNEIIYSGDPNLVDNGLLFYHDTLPYISIISNVDGIINVSTKVVRLGSTTGTIINEYKVSYDYSKDYLTIKALEDGTVSFNIWKSMGTDMITSISYSTDDGETWTTTNNTDNKEEHLQISVNVNTGDKILWKGIATLTGYNDSEDYTDVVGSFFSSDCEFNASGNVMSLLYDDNFIGQTSLNNIDSIFAYLFSNRDKQESCQIVSAEKLILPAKTLTSKCYLGIFSGCTSLTIAPELPATTLAEYCYAHMFWSCTSLTTTPVLSATTLASYCYDSMFRYCTSLTTTPMLPATILASYCYYSMFAGCTALTTAPELPATILANYCYRGMFQDCTSLTTASKLPATTLIGSCYRFMFNGCTSLTIAPELPATTLTSNCYYSMFAGCTALTTAPKLPATTLAENCYRSMFEGCTSLTSAPELPAITLVTGCYNSIFYGCSNLNYIKAMFTTTPANAYTTTWVQGVAATGTFAKNADATWNVTGTNGVPSGWYVEQIDPESGEVVPPM